MYHCSIPIRAYRPRRIRTIARVKLINFLTTGNDIIRYLDARVKENVRHLDVHILALVDNSVENKLRN